MGTSGVPDASGLSGRTVSHFRVLEPLGAGGMGVVYRAEDLTLGRTVALKFMLPDYAIDDMAMARFLREARTIATLDHSNICTVHEAGRSEEGHLFLAMSYYAGETLKDRLTKSGALPADQALDIAAQIGRGLACAHAAGIVHRDLKPANVMLTADGTVKILDFGLAKTGDQTMTASGIVMGTVAYMSPEQLLGEPLDARSDLWALGIMLVEMLTGKHPASADPTPEGVARQVEARNPSGMRPEVLGELTRVVGRLMRRDPGQRYQTANDVVSDLHAVREQLSGARPYRAAGASTRSRLALGAGAIVILFGIALGVMRWTRSSDDRRPSSASPGARISLAVLPLKNYATPDQEYFADGMTDELIATLTKIEALHVIAHQSVLQFKQSTRPVPEIARSLNVKYLVDGSVRQDSTRVTITASLVDAASNASVWNESIDGDRRDVMALQRDVALAIARAIQVRLTPQDQTRLAPVHEPKPEALTNYIRGTQARYDANITGEFDKAIPYLKAAIEKDSNFAAPYAGLASVYATMHDETQARALVDKALALDPKLAEAHIVRGTLFENFHWKLSEAERAYREAIANNPGFAESHHELSMLLIRLRRFDEALQEGRQAVLYSPTSLRFINGVAEVQIYSGDEAAVLATADSLLAKDSTYANAYQLKGFAYEVLEKWDDALNAWTECLRVTPTGCEYGRAHIGYIYGRSGRRDAARRILDTLLARVSAQDRARSQGALAWDIATVYLGLGDWAHALTWLERATDAHEGYMLYLAADPTYKPLRGARRFEALLKKLGLPSET